jgi:predicted PurR-regulated permease PerM
MDNKDKIFKNIDFDIEEPAIGHFDRFEAKLNKGQKSRKNARLYSFIAIAASIVLFFGIWIGNSFSNQQFELANISPEMKETQNYFVSTISKELEKINLERNTETEPLINDALEQINKLDNQYQLLLNELKESTEDQRIIYAIISNFQQRIDVLQSLLVQIEEVKQLKTQKNDTYV